MRIHLFTIVLLFSSIQIYAQKLGLSSFSPNSQRTTNNDDVQIFNIGEPIINQTQNEDLIINNGLLNGVISNNFTNANLHVRFFFDENENGSYDIEEYYLEQGNFSINDNLYQNFSKEGVLFAAPIGEITVKYEIGSNDFWILTSQAEQTVDINNIEDYKIVTFGIKPIVENTKINTYLNSDNFRCGFTIDYILSVVNSGTTTVESVAFLKIDERISDVTYSEIPDIEIDSNYVGWNFSLNPFESRIIKFSLRVPLIQDGFDLGQVFKSLSWVENAVPREEFCFEQELRCAYDPNDKLVNPSRPDSLALIDNPLVYTLRFQNTGNDYALNIVVTDTLSEHLDISTFRVINTSHPDHLTVVQNMDNPRIVDFKFDNIFLPDSTTNLAGSNGHIMFTIKPNEEVTEETVINNTGFIYFDFNPAIITNTTGSTLVEEFPIVSISEEINSNDIKVFPNPTYGQISFNKKVSEILVYNIHGALIRTFQNTAKIDISRESAGTYLLELRIGDYSSYEKIVLINQK